MCAVEWVTASNQLDKKLVFKVKVPPSILGGCP